MPAGMSDWKEHPHRRLNPLTGEWVLVSPHRVDRPWQGRIERPPAQDSPRYDPNCYLCPGNARARGARNPAYAGAYVFDNDFAALLPDSRPARIDEGGLLVAESERGICRVVCFSPRHDLTLARMDVDAIAGVVDAWRDQYVELGRLPFINHVQIFENRGEMMGCSNPHPHCQIWANDTLPNEAVKEGTRQKAFADERGKCLLCEYLALERGGERMVYENDSFAVVVPFWAVWPFETLVISKRHAGSIDEFSAEERRALADILKQITTRYENVFEAPFPYTMGFHQRPTDGEPHGEWHFHAHYYPPLLRSPVVRKFMVGYEMLATPQRDITAEMAAARLRRVPAVHYLDKAADKRR
jgi:UDPglucose--hexose-1-phosphate uridylyltransferase